MGAVPPTRPNLRPRSVAAVVASRVAAPGTSDTTPIAPTERAQSSRLWPTLLVWAVLGAAIAAAWGLLLFGDSLRPVSG